MGEQVTRESVRAAAIRWAHDQSTVDELIHDGFNDDPVSGGFAFLADRGLVVWSFDGSYKYAMDPGTDVGRLEIVERWWSERRYRNRTITFDDLDPCQRAAVGALVRGCRSVVDLAEVERCGATDVAAADYVLVLLRRYTRESTESAALRAFAGVDGLLSPLEPHERAHECLVCGRPAVGWDQQSVCDRCYERTDCVHGRRVKGYNTSFGGGFRADHIADGSICPQVTRDGMVSIAGHPCEMGEERIGGVYVVSLRRRSTEPDQGNELQNNDR